MVSVAKRIVFFVGGYGPMPPAEFFSRLSRKLSLFSKIWDVQAELSEPVDDDQCHVTRAHVTAKSKGSKVETDFTLLVHDDLVQAGFREPFVWRLAKYLVAFADYLLTGTFFRLFAANWRFALYFLYPFAALIFFVALGYLAGRLYLAAGVPGGPIAAWCVGILVMLAVGYWIGNRYFVFHLMDLWSFSDQYLHNRRKDMDEHMENWSRIICDAIRKNAHDEILLVGHSTGGALVLDIAARVAERCEKERISASGFTIMTIGSTLLKIGLHPAATQFRQKVQALSRHSDVRWFEYQSLTDIINFYKCDPFAMMGLKHDRDDEFPAIRQIRVRDMLEKSLYKRLKRNFLRVHYQFINANSNRYFYDFCMICFGGISLRQRFNAGLLGFIAQKDPEREGNGP